MNILDGRKIAAKIKTRIKSQIENFDITPGLGILIVGNRKDSRTYVNMKKRTCTNLGIFTKEICLESNCHQEEVIEKIEYLNKDPKIHGILVQLPLPSQINQTEVLKKISLEKDVEGFHLNNIAFLNQNNLSECLAPCTPIGCIALLDEYNIELKGKHVVVVGKSDVVGLPISLLCLHREATVTICHIHTENLQMHTKLADILIVACGKPNLINGDDVKDGVVVIDIGINHVATEDSSKLKLVGDVNFDEVSKKASWITPVPGGVGPMTIAMLIVNLVKLTSIKNKKFNKKLESLLQ